SWPLVSVRSDAEVYAPSGCVSYLAVQRQRQQPERWRVLDRGHRTPSRSPLGPLAMLGGIELEPVLGYNSFDVLRYKEYLQFVTDRDEPVIPRKSLFGYPIVGAFPIVNQGLLDLLGVRYLLQPDGPHPELAAGDE